MSNQSFTHYEVKGLRSRFDGSYYEWLVLGVAKQPCPWRSSVLAHFNTEAEARAHLQTLQKAA